MARVKYDASSKWLIQHHGEALLRLAGVRGLVSWKAVQAEPVQSRRLPDGLIEAHRRGRPRPILFALEVSTYPYSRLARQALEDALQIYLVLGVVPEVVALVLHPRGQKPAPRDLVLRSEEGTTTIRVTWKVIEVWKIPAEELLAADDVGLIPLVPLAGFDGPLDLILEECRERIERDAPEREQEDLRVMTHFFTGLKYNEPRAFEKLGGDRAMLKTGSPLLRSILEEETRKARRESERDTTENNIIAVLRARFGPEAEALEAKLGFLSLRALKECLARAATCPDLASFREPIEARRRKRRS